MARGEKEGLDVGALEPIDVLENLCFWEGIERERKKKRRERGGEEERTRWSRTVTSTSVEVPFDAG